MTAQLTNHVEAFITRPRAPSTNTSAGLNTICVNKHRVCDSESWNCEASHPIIINHQLSLLNSGHSNDIATQWSTATSGVLVDMHPMHDSSTLIRIKQQPIDYLHPFVAWPWKLTLMMPNALSSVERSMRGKPTDDSHHWWAAPPLPKSSQTCLG